MYNHNYPTSPPQTCTHMQLHTPTPPPTLQRHKQMSHNCKLLWKLGASLVAQTVKNLPVVQETWLWSLGWEDPLKEGMVTHSSILAWRIPMEPGRLQSMGLQRVRRDWVTKHTHGSWNAIPFCHSFLKYYINSCKIPTPWFSFLWVFSILSRVRKTSTWNIYWWNTL